jgi:uncharacterized protein DUF6883
MAPLPNASRAIIDLQKIEDYCLDPTHPRGRHKARVFRQALGIERRDSEWLRQALLTGADTSEAAEVAGDTFGARWLVDVPVTRQNRRAVIRTVWIVRSGEQMPRFVTCWVL